MDSRSKLRGQGPERAMNRVAARLGSTLFAAAAIVSLAPLTSARADVSGKADSRVAQMLATPRANGWTSVIVNLQNGITPEAEAAINQLSGDIYRRLSVIKSVAV